MSPLASSDDPARSLLQPLFLWSLPFTFLYFWLPIASKDLGADALGIGGLFSAFTLTTLLMRPVVGWALDRFGRRPFLVLAMLIYAAAMGVFAAVNSLAWMYAARLIQGVGSAFLWAAIYTIVSDTASPGDRGRALGEVNQTITRGGLIGIFAALALMQALPGDAGWRAAFAAFGLTTGIAAWLAWRNLRDARPSGEEPVARRGVSRRLLGLLALVCLIGVPEAMLAPIYLIYLQDKFSVNVTTLAWAFFPAGLAAAFVSTRLGALSDRFGRARMMALGLAGAGIVSLFMPALKSLVGLAALYTVSSIMWGIVDPARAAMVTDLGGEERRGASYGLYDLAQNLGFTVGPVLGGLIYDAVGKAVPFYLDGIVLIVGTAWVLLFLRTATAAQPEASATG